MVVQKTKNFLKDKKTGLKKLLLVVIVLIICISMIPWALSTYTPNTNSDNNWVKVGSKNVQSGIILAEYNSFIEKNYLSIQQNPFMLVNFLNNLISQYITLLLFANEAEEIRLGVDETVVLELISKIPAFKNPDGSFNRDEFTQRLRLVFGSEEVFIENLKNNILKDQVLEAIYSNIAQPDYITYLDYLAITQERSIEYVEISKNILPAIESKPTDNDLLKIRDENKAAYSVPELRSAEIVYLDVSKAAVSSPSKEELLSYYDKNKSNYMMEEMRVVYMANLKDENAANEFYNKVKDLTLEAVLKEESFRNLGEVAYKDLPEDISSAVFSLNLNKPSAPVKSGLGWHVFVVSKVIPAKPKDFEAVRNEISQEVMLNKRVAFKDEKRNQFLEVLSQNVSFEETAKKISGAYKKLDDVSEVSFSNNKSAAVKDVRFNQDVLKSVFKTTVNASSGLVEDQEGNFYVVKVTAIKPERLKDLSEIKKELSQVWENNEVTKKLDELSNTIMAGLSSGKALNSFGFKINNIKASLVSNTNNLPFAGESIDVLFSESKNKGVQGKLLNGNTFVAVVKDIKLKNINNGKDNKDVVNFGNYIAQSYIQGFIMQYSKNLENKYSIKVNEKAIIDRLSPSAETQE